MSLFDILFPGRKATEAPAFQDTVPELPDVTPEPVAAWPFPVGGAPTSDEEKPVPDVHKIEEQHRLSARYQRIAEEKAALKRELKDLVIQAPELGIHFYHAGETTIAWRHHNVPDSEHGGVRNPRLIDIATAICNPRDQFAKWMGSAYAAQALIDGRYITVKAREGSHSIFDEETKTWRAASDMVSIQDAIELIGLAIET